jgi:hypothetical protein
MSSRAEEKARRRAEREAAEREAAKCAKRARIARTGGAGAVTIAVVAGIVALALTAGGGTGDAQPVAAAPAGDEAALPPRREENLKAAVEKAGATFRELPSLGAAHRDGSVPLSEYNSNPPTSGTHNPVPAEPGVYEPGNGPAHEHWSTRSSTARSSSSTPQGPRSSGSASSRPWPPSARPVATPRSCSRTRPTCPTRWPPWPGRACSATSSSPTRASRRSAPSARSSSTKSGCRARHPRQHEIGWWLSKLSGPLR